MKNIHINELAHIINAQTTNELDVTIKGVSIDTRTLKPGDCFFAIKGENSDGHDYFDLAFEKGAACAIVESGINHKLALKVDDTIKALGTLAKWYRNQNSFKVVAITGSVGKTTTRNIAYHVLSKHFRVSQAPKNFNNYIGLPLTLLNADPEDQIVLAELGTDKPGEIAYLSDIASPDLAVITKICDAHLEGFGDLDAIKKEKLSITKGLKKNGTFIKDALGKHKVNIIRCQQSLTEFTIDNKNMTIPLLGIGNIENAITAWAICQHFDISIEDFAKALETLPPIPMRTELFNIGKLTVINDCYNANPTSMNNALEILAQMDAKGRRKVFICGDMAELGEKKEIMHQQLGQKIADSNIDMLIAVGQLAKIAAQTAKKNKKNGLHIACFNDIAETCNNLGEFIKQNDIILLKGSRAARLELAFENLQRLFA